MLEGLKKEFPNAMIDVERKIEFTQTEKCRIETTKGKTIVRRGVVIPQSMETKAQEYSENLKTRGIIRYTSSQKRNPIRFIEKPNGSLRLVSYLFDTE